IQSPISPFAPRELSVGGIERQIRAFIRCAQLAREAGYDGIEIMGSEGYLINQFLVTHTNHRTDDWGGSYAKRIRLAVEIVRRSREAVGHDFILIYRLSMIDLIPDGSSWEEIVLLAKAVEAAGATLINSGIGWHEARVPTIATSVPRGAFTWVTKKLRTELRAAG
ncbi:MAG TPA: NADPH-dependent 2,4-dienoyl-CoA reductase, partial [Polaromonas sp.]|nr:NADPH-dependent 2,4-dienoyl-CoA reductase [Polaromonas sp.]